MMNNDLGREFNQVSQAVYQEHQENLKLRQQVEQLQAAAAASAPQAPDDRAEEKAPVLAAPATEALTLLIDGSGSMSMKDDKDKSKPKLLYATEAAARFRYEKRDTVGAFWGHKLLPIDFRLPLETMLKGVGTCCTELSLAVEQMEQTVATSKAPQHFVIISDGDLNETKKVAEQLNKLLDTERATVDFVVLSSRSGSMMQKLAEEIAPKHISRVGYHTANEETLGAVLKGIFATRIQPPKPPKQYYMSAK